ncbi:hypothetical protein SAICODRAFT_51594 [Saitoella complicata NRRL Y-17804]|uniref:uncharacterized protein n=1 Tax=Saitoella complicata (strain BCRC 22490 / CBS 7301 / JCM 7358 / NBRC 10748 / NRRL Y-17804) TaxID=698492 RepID=UPI0008673549|nr:uncharacterized protein SAICODRAFT_51594 [Saitoella complicata NRRL Y-17804]ODQ56245.1 hypothetical protein SAICODRAFT_51594 [Saitoella complicata NRRL Y-17804]
MTFTTTPLGTMLWGDAWNPKTPVAYAFTWLFLFGLSIFSRMMYAGKAWAESKWLKTGADGEARAGSVSSGDTVASFNTAAQAYKLLPWRMSVDVPRALIQFVIAGVQYLLMLAVMTMNVGYFFSVLGGIFFGELIVGRYTAAFHPVGSDLNEHH